MAEHIHWKKEFPSTYLGSQDLPENSDMIVQVKEVGEQEIQNQGGKQTKLVMSFENGVKPLILNKINCKNIAKALGSDYLDNWIGKKLQLYVDPAVSTPQGITSAVRVRDFAPTTTKEA